MLPGRGKDSSLASRRAKNGGKRPAGIGESNMEHAYSVKLSKIVKDLDQDLTGKDVLIVEDIIDSGHTLAYLIEVLKQRGPRSIRLCTLLDKPERRVKKQVKVDYVCFTIPDEFVVGYGLDYLQKYRNLPYIGVVEQ